MKNKKLWLIAIIAIASFSFCTVATAQTGDTGPTIEITPLSASLGNVQATILPVTAPAVDALESLDEVVVAELKSEPSGFGLFWKNLKQSIGTAFTFDAQKKAEKRLQTAEEKIRWAEWIAANSTNTNAKEKATNLIEQANKQIEKIESKKTELMQKIDARKERLIENMVKHESNKEKILDKIEGKLPPEKLDKFNELRDKIEAQNEKIMEVLKEGKFKAEISRRIELKKEELKKKHEERKKYRNENKELMKKASDGDKDAKSELEEKNRKHFNIESEKPEVKAETASDAITIEPIIVEPTEPKEVEDKN